MLQIDFFQQRKELQNGFTLVNWSFSDSSRTFSNLLRNNGLTKALSFSSFPPGVDRVYVSDS